MMKNYEYPLNDDEFVELGELLASFPEPFEPMEADYLDGYLTALLCLPEEPSPSEWMPYIFDSQARKQAFLSSDQEQDRLEELIYRRYRSIDTLLAQCKAIDPIIYEIEDDRGHPVKGYDSVAAVIPFALGFYEVLNRWDGLKESGNELIDSALLGILRHLPEDIAGDLNEIKTDLDLESPIENLNQALEDIAVSVAEIVSVTRGFVLKEERPNAQKKIKNRQNNRTHPVKNKRHY